MGSAPKRGKWTPSRFVALIVFIMFGTMLTIWNATGNGQRDWVGSIIWTLMLVVGAVVVGRRAGR